MTVASSGVSLLVPQVIARAIDSFTAGKLDLSASLTELAALSIGSFLLGIVQAVIQSIASERVARDLRTRLAEKVSQQSYSSVVTLTPAKLLTNFTSDVDAIKNFVAQGVASLISSVFVIIAAGALLLWLNWRLAAGVLSILPFDWRDLLSGHGPRTQAVRRGDGHRRSPQSGAQREYRWGRASQAHQ